MAKVTKTQITIRVMTENADKPMAEVVPLIAKANSVTETVAKGAYRWVVANGLAPGNVERARAPKEEPKASKASKPVTKPAVKAKATPKVKEAKTVEAKPKGNRFTGKLKANVKSEPEPKTEDELASIKAANLKRMQEVTAKMKKRGLMPGQYANPEHAGLPDGFDADQARAEVDQMYKDLESFEMPKFLTKDQVKALV